MRAVVGLVVLAAVGCQVQMGGHMLLASLTLEAREPEVIAQLCGRPIDENEIGRRFATLKVEDIAAKRALFGSEGHGSARVSFTPEQGSACSGTIEYDFSQDARITSRATSGSRPYRRSVHQTSTFYYANVVVKRP